MTAQKAAQDPASPRSPTAAPTQRVRKPWVKKTPVEVVLDQINRLRNDVLKKEEELRQAKHQLEKLEAAVKVLDAT